MATDKASGSEYFHERRRSAARSLDESVQAQMVRAFSGLSPIALSLAHADWAMHLMASPGRQSQLAVRAFELSVQAWNKAADQSADAAPEKDGRFTDPGWSQWPYNAVKEGFRPHCGCCAEGSAPSGMRCTRESTPRSRRRT